VALTPRQALEIVLGRVSVLPTERVPLRAAVGRILRQEVMAERDNPPFDRVCMDGVAIDSAAFAAGARAFWLQGTQAAGAVPQALSRGDAAIEVMTGAVLPPGTDCVVPLEEYTLAAGSLTLNADATAEPWRNVQRRGSDSAPGVPMLRPGVRLRSAEIAIIASAGLASVEVSRQPRVRVISTGDELVEPGMPIADHQVRRSNAYAVTSALQEQGFGLVVDDHLRDDEALMRERLGEHLAANDVLVLSGGVSKGKFDFVPKTLQHLGVEEIFYQVAQRPGRPMWFGLGPRRQLVFGLPGNPVSTSICFVRYVLPALRAAMGATPPPVERVAMAREMRKGRPMIYFMPVTLEPRDGSPTVASPRPPSGSGDFLALAGTDGFVELPARTEGYPDGFVADFYRW
jgi:molybdopterin molybdotransferase